MARKSYVQIGGKLYDKSEPLPMGDASVLSSATVRGDLQDFRSPIDGKYYSGRAGLREHCARHDVVPTADLKGLPPKPANQTYVPDRAAIRESLQRSFYK
jgi:hypothetical protein